MQILTYLTTIIALAVLARAFFSWNDANEQIVSADTTEVIVSDTDEPNMPNPVQDNRQNNNQDSSTVANASAQNDDTSWTNTDTPPLIIQPTANTNHWSLTIDNSPLPPSINHEVPFFPQAPDGNRNLPRAEACEEASIALANYFIKGKSLTKDQFRTDLLAMVDRQMELFNDYIHTSIEQTKQLYLDFYGGEAYIVDNPTIQQIKSILAQWDMIVAPFAWRKLGNPYYSGQGPWYHMLLIRWYDETYFYTNDVGTRRGDNFPYTHEIIMEALHDLNYDDINQGAKRILVITE